MAATTTATPSADHVTLAIQSAGDDTPMSC